jgi:nucleotidyltransferase AbiEii toxin of type IV toxin-antitoxin system
LGEQFAAAASPADAPGADVPDRQPLPAKGLSTMDGESMRGQQSLLEVHGHLEAEEAMAHARAQIPVQVDIGFGATISPPATLQVYPTLLHFPPPEILTYSRETVVAEKLEAMVSLGVM